MEVNNMNRRLKNNLVRDKKAKISRAKRINKQLKENNRKKITIDLTFE